MVQMITELLKYRSLLWAFTIRNIQLKYKQTVMGFLWAIFMPLIIVFSGIVVKAAMAQMSGRPIQLAEMASVAVKSLSWAFFVAALKFSVNSLVGNMDLVKKIYFPKEVFPLSYTLGQLFDLFIASAAFTVIFFFAHIGVSIYLLWLPVLILLLVMLTAGLGMTLSCANLFYRDVRYVVDVILTFGIFFTPVFYEASMFKKWETVILLNPVAPILESINRVVVLQQSPDLFWLSYSAAWAFVSFFGGWYIFDQAEPLFAEKI